MNHDAYPDSYIREILTSVKSVAMVGASPSDVRPSYFVFKYLSERGYDMIPINPGQVGKSLAGKPFVGSLADIGRPFDMLDIFRNSDAAAIVVDEALALTFKPKVIWMQLGVRNDQAAAKAEAAGLKVVMNRCPKIEYARLTSEIQWMGINSRTLSSKRAPVPTGNMKLSLNRASIGGGATAAADRVARETNSDSKPGKNEIS
jgi:predicted CoA-binding protein